MVDLHMHTKHSDGEKSVIEILQMAQEEKLDCISITDHDTLDAYEELKHLDINKYYTGKIITGVELKICYNKIPMEVLGYNFDIEKLKNSEWVNIQKKLDNQNIKLKYYKDLIKKLGLKFNENIEINYSGFADNTVFYELISYEENFDKLKELGVDISADLKGYYRGNVSNIENVFYFDETEYQLSLEKAVELIHKAGGIAILAHPLGTYEVENLEKIIDEMLDLKLLDGLECMHRIMTKEQSDYLINLCNKHNLIMSGGSDYHRSSRDKFAYVNFKSTQIPNELVQRIVKI